MSEQTRPARAGATLSRSLNSVPTDWWLQAAIALPIIAYGLSTILVPRPASGYNTFWDGWVYNIAQSLPLIPIVMRMRRSVELRGAWGAMATGVALNAIGNLVWTYHDQNLNPVPDPAPSDAFYLASYLGLIIGVAILTQSSFGRVRVSVRLDGVIAGLAIGAVCGMLWFGPLLKASGRPLAIIVNMAYPACDLVLIVLLVAGLAPHRYRPNWTTLLLMTGLIWFVVGDVVSLNQVAAGTYMTGTPLDACWPVGIFFMGLASSVRDRRRSGGSRSSVTSLSGITVVPVVFGIVSLGVIAATLVRRDSAIVLSMAIAALGLVIARMWLSLREVRQSSVNYQDARTDYLTGLPNRRAFLERLQSTFLSEQTEGMRAGVLLVDLDGFKEVNDALGHAAGDQLLCVVANRFDHLLGNRGILARLGGDEYALACPVTREEELVEIAHEFSRSLSDPSVIDGTSVRVGASIGVAVAQPDRATAGELLRCADVAMYEAKRMQCGVSVYRTATDPNSRDGLALLDALRDAIDNRALILHYQPTLDMRTATVHGVEALVRWQHPTLGLLHPDSFIPLAERHGLMPQLTRAVLDLALAEAARLDQNGQRLNMSVNISRYDLVDEDMADYVEQVLAVNGYPHDRLTLEITESALGGDPERAKRCVLDLRARGLKISIDDYGVGYSSMSQLLGLAVDELKVDKSFVLRLTWDPRAQAIVRSAIEVARALNLSVVAEGIESKEVLQLLRTMGADIGQGYVIAHPYTARQLDEYLDQPDRISRLFPYLPPLRTVS